MLPSTFETVENFSDFAVYLEMKNEFSGVTHDHIKQGYLKVSSAQPHFITVGKKKILTGVTLTFTGPINPDDADKQALQASPAPFFKSFLIEKDNPDGFTSPTKILAENSQGKKELEIELIKDPVAGGMPDQVKPKVVATFLDFGVQGSEHSPTATTTVFLSAPQIKVSGDDTSRQYDVVHKDHD